MPGIVQLVAELITPRCPDPQNSSVASLNNAGFQMSSVPSGGSRRTDNQTVSEGSEPVAVTTIVIIANPQRNLGR